MTESETASFVLAYLLKNNYSQTATSFLQECQTLPSKSLLILPETPLQSVIAEHKLRSDTKVLVNKMGQTNAWMALWDKLQTTLKQLKLVLEGGSHVTTAKHLLTNFSAPNCRPKTVSRRKTLPPQAPTPPPPPPPAPPAPQSPQQDPTVPSTFSPHRRKPVPRRREQTTSPSGGPPLSPGTQHVLDSLMGDSELPSKLAEIINKFVARDNVTSDVSPLTLDTIIDQTYSDPALEGLISEVVEGPSHVVNPARDHVSSAKDHVSSVRDHVIDGGNPSSDNQDVPPAKRFRAESLITEQDIDAFLDQLHS